MNRYSIYPKGFRVVIAAKSVAAAKHAARQFERLSVGLLSELQHEDRYKTADSRL